MNGNNAGQGGFFVQPAAYDWTGQGDQGQSPMQGLQGLMQPQQQPNQFASQTPGAPQQPGRVDQTSFGMGQQMPGQGGQGGNVDFMQLLSANIAKRFGGM